MADVIIVGSGAAGVAAALQLADLGITPLILDVGHERPANLPRAEGNLYSYRRRHDTYDLLVGERFQGLSLLLGKANVPVKLTAPNLEYVTQGSERLAPIDEVGFSAVQSFAAGGLANAWGAGLYRFLDEDLRGFPIGEEDLKPYFNRLTDEIGISGVHDDLAPFFGKPENLYPPLRLSKNCERVYRRYRKRRASFNSQGIHLGQAHVAVLSEARDGRETYAYTNTEMCQESTAIYSPTMTLERLIRAKKVVYQRGVLVQSWREHADGTEVSVLDLSTNARTRFNAKILILAAGAINTSKIVLASHEDYRTRLRLLENPAIQIPFILPTAIGTRLDTDAFGLVQLNLIWDSPGYDTRLQGSIMDLTAVTRAEFFGRLPYSARQNLALLRYLLPGMIVMQLFFPAKPGDAPLLSLQANGRLRIEDSSGLIDLRPLGALLKATRRMGAWTHPSLIARVPMGHAIHYAGTLPMRETPGPYECDPNGRLHGTRSVYVADSAAFSTLPAKNMSFAMMANAMRVARRASGTL